MYLSTNKNDTLHHHVLQLPLYCHLQQDLLYVRLYPGLEWTPQLPVALLQHHHLYKAPPLSTHPARFCWHTSLLQQCSSHNNMNGTSPSPFIVVLWISQCHFLIPFASLNLRPAMFLETAPSPASGTKEDPSLKLNCIGSCRKCRRCLLGEVLNQEVVHASCICDGSCSSEDCLADLLLDVGSCGILLTFRM